MTFERSPLDFGNYYHIYNRGNNHENIFVETRNYGYFIRLWWRHTFVAAETYAYCLLKNHFHAVVRIRDQAEMEGIVRRPSQYFSNLFNAYARGVNPILGRSGSLFERPFERKPITLEAHLMQAIVYVHQNPQRHGLAGDFREWGFSSYADLISDGPTRLQREKVLALFGGRENFERVHRDLLPAAERNFEYG